MIPQRFVVFFFMAEITEKFSSVYSCASTIRVTKVSEKLFISVLLLKESIFKTPLFRYLDFSTS